MGSGQAGSLFGLPRSHDVVRGGFRSTAHLVGAINFPSFVQLPDRKPLARIVDEKQGTVEFWFRPVWSGKFPTPRHSKSEYGWLDHFLFHFGEPHPRYPQSFWPSGLVIRHMGYYGSLSMDVANRRNAKWGCDASIKESPQWLPSEWMHIAAVWDADSAPEDWVRLYVNGVRVSGKASVQKPERLGRDKSVRVQIDPPFAIQLGGLNTGRRPANGAFDELRISRVPRYTADFEPPQGELPLDANTTALFHFNGSLKGEGLTQTGTHYKLLAKPGFQTYH
jgi:hypothetical protein